MSDPITPAISDRICKHMNEDHGDAIVLYAKAFGNTPDAETAQMISIDPQGMNLSAFVKGKNLPVRVEFEHTLQDSEDAHQTLIAMVKQARQMSSQL
jgi:putative heme iron utilization protein